MSTLACEAVATVEAKGRPLTECFDRYRPRSEWFHNPDGIHGLGHAARVLVHADDIAGWMGGQGYAVDLEVVRWAAVVHDVGRVDDGADLEHGHRSATWFLAHADTVAPHLIEAQRQAIASTVRWHAPWDLEVPPEARTPEWFALKDADALDRIRLGGGRGLDPKLLRTARARASVDTARALFTSADTWDLVGKPRVSITQPSTNSEYDEVMHFLAANMAAALHAEHNNLVRQSQRGSSDVVIFTSRENGVVVGFVCVKFEPYLTYLAGYLTYLLVAGAKRTDHGARLMQAAEDAARRRTDRLYLRVTPENQRWASRFLVQRGYRAMGNDWPGGYFKVLPPEDARAGRHATGALTMTGLLDRLH